MHSIPWNSMVTLKSIRYLLSPFEQDVHYLILQSWPAFLGDRHGIFMTELKNAFMWKCRFESSKVSNTPSPSPKEPLQFFPNWIFQDTPSKPTILVSQWGLTKLPALNEITMQDLASVVGQLHRQWNLQEHITNKRHTSLLDCFRPAMYEPINIKLTHRSLGWY